MHMEGGGKVQPLPVMQEEFAGSLQKDWAWQEGDAGKWLNWVLCSIRPRESYTNCSITWTLLSPFRFWCYQSLPYRQGVQLCPPTSMVYRDPNLKAVHSSVHFFSPTLAPQI
jgi:hypothetical protein